MSRRYRKAGQWHELIVQQAAGTESVAESATTSGGRCRSAAEILADTGLEQLWILRGGYGA